MATRTDTPQDRASAIDGATTDPSARSRRFRQWGAVAALAFGMAGYTAIAEWQRTHAFMINASDSLPEWAFFVTATKTPVRGDFIFFTPPDVPLVRKHFGRDSGPFGKQVIGMPGDVVAHKGADVVVNGRVVAHMKPRSRMGETLTPGPTGVIPRDCYYVGSAHPDGFDSRYAEIGFACRKQILGTGEAVL